MARKTFVISALAVLLAVVGILLIILGCFLILKPKQCAAAKGKGSSGDQCELSVEASSSGFADFLGRVEEAYHEYNRHNYIHKEGFDPTESLKVLKEKYKAYDPSPENIKVVTDKAFALLEEIKTMKIETARLKPREKKALAQVKHFLQHVFGAPYDTNYYAGDFLLGPNLFCWQPICDLGADIRANLKYFAPFTVKDMKFLVDKLREYNETISRYIANLNYGIKAGFVRSVEECKAGMISIKRTSLQVSLKGEQGIFDEAYMKYLLSDAFLRGIQNNTKERTDWEAEYGKSVNESFREYVLEYLGKPFKKLFDYLEFDHMRHCLPSNVSSGLAGLPVDYVYTDGNPNYTQKTTKILPGGEKLDGKKAYTMIMPYFTTTSTTPDQVHELGKEMLAKLYPQVLEIARQVGNTTNNETAEENFIKRLNETDMYFVLEDIPQNESNEVAHIQCTDEESAKKNCPKRWAAMQNWFQEAKKVMSMLDPKTVKMFYFTGNKHTTPNCPVEMRPNFNPSSGAQSYQRSTSTCSRTAKYNIPFFLDRPGPKYEEWSVNAHEARPGHHTQVQGLVEHFRDSCGGVVRWLDYMTYYTAFTEGWALYAENPLIAQETDVYDNEPFQKYGMLKWQVWRAIRLIVDTGLHYKGFSREKALKYFADYAWDTSDGAEKEVTRYQSDPGQATAYMIGQLHIIKVRDYVTKELGEKFNLKDFHYFLLAQGSAPLAYLEESMEEYVRCVKDPKGEGCNIVLNPVTKVQGQTARGQKAKEKVWVPPEKSAPFREHFI